MKPLACLSKLDRVADPTYICYIYVALELQATSASTPAQIWYLPQSCNGTTSQVLMHTIHYDDKPPYLTVVRTVGNVATTISSTMPATMVGRIL